MTKNNSEEPPLDKGLEVQKKVSDLKGEMDILEEQAEDRDTEIIGFKKTIQTAQEQMEKFAMTLGVANDYPILLGEIEKLICVEDDLETLRSKMRKLKGEDKEEVGKAIVQGEKAVLKMREKVVKQGKEVKQLKSKRNVDRYETGELAKETVKKFFKGRWENIKKIFKLIIKKIKEVKKYGNNNK